MLDIKFIEYIVLMLLSIPSGFITYSLVIGSAKSVVEGNRRKFFIHLIITLILIGIIYTLCHSVFNSIKIEKITKNYNEKVKEYSLVKESSWTDDRNAFAKNQLLYNFYHKNKDKNICNDLKSIVVVSLKEAIEKMPSFSKTEFAKKSVEICEITYEYIQIEKEKTCATKETGFICYWMNPIFKKFNTKFKIASVEPPIIIEKEANKEMEENILDKEEFFEKQESINN